MTVDEIYDMTFRLNSKVQKVRSTLKFNYPNYLEHKFTFAECNFGRAFDFSRIYFNPSRLEIGLQWDAASREKTKIWDFIRYFKRFSKLRTATCKFNKSEGRHFSHRRRTTIFNHQLSYPGFWHT